MIRIAITQAAYEAIASTMPLGSVGFGLLGLVDYRKPRGDNALT
jgi:hypothetical protein